MDDEASLSENYVTVSNGFHDNETLLASHEITSFSLLLMSAKIMIFNIMKPCIKLPLKLVLDA